MAHRLSSRARADLDEIWHHIVTEGGSESAADRIVDLITFRFLLLTEWPRLGRARNELRRGLRSLPVGDYVIFYRVPGLASSFNACSTVAGYFADHGVMTVRAEPPPVVANAPQPRVGNCATAGRGRSVKDLRDRDGVHHALRQPQVYTTPATADCCDGRRGRDQRRDFPGAMADRLW